MTTVEHARYEEDGPVVAGVAFTPLTREQQRSINAFQVSGVSHPLTCGGDPRHTPLVAERDGMFCIDCDYTQDWVHAWMGDWSWRPIDGGVHP